MDWVFCSDWTCTVGATQVDELVPTLACEHFFIIGGKFLSKAASMHTRIFLKMYILAVWPFVLMQTPFRPLEHKSLKSLSQGKAAYLRSHEN